MCIRDSDGTEQAPEADARGRACHDGLLLGSVRTAAQEQRAKKGVCCFHGRHHVRDVAPRAARAASGPRTAVSRQPASITSGQRRIEHRRHTHANMPAQCRSASLGTPSTQGSRAMILGMSVSTFTLVHVLLSLIGIFAGLIVVYGFLKGRLIDGWNGVFLVTTIMTSVTGCLLYTSDAADERSSVDLGGRRI